MGFDILTGKGSLANSPYTMGGIVEVSIVLLFDLTKRELTFRLYAYSKKI